MSYRYTSVITSSFKFKFESLKACNFIKKRFQDTCFSVIIAKFLRTTILKKICKRLLIHLPMNRPAHAALAFSRFC